MYVLPDYATTKLGYVKKSNEAVTADEQILVLNNERITVPELLFHPSDIGMNQAGIAETIVQSVEKSGCFSDEQKQLLYDSVILVGGSTKFPNFKERVYVCLSTVITVLAHKNCANMHPANLTFKFCNLTST